MGRKEKEPVKRPGERTLDPESLASNRYQERSTEKNFKVSESLNLNIMGHWSLLIEKKLVLKG
jgi:hypothetical protein